MILGNLSLVLEVSLWVACPARHIVIACLPNPLIGWSLLRNGLDCSACAVGKMAYLCWIRLPETVPSAQVQTGGSELESLTRCNLKLFMAPQTETKTLTREPQSRCLTMCSHQQTWEEPRRNNALPNPRSSEKASHRDSKFTHPSVHYLQGTRTKPRCRGGCVRDAQGGEVGKKGGRPRST